MKKNLVLVHTAEFEAAEDWHEIAGHVREMADDIEVFVVDNEAPDSEQVGRIAERPTLVFSQAHFRNFAPPRGKLHTAQQIAKFDVLQRLAESKVPVPPTAILEPGMKLDPAFWGPVVLLKPMQRRRGTKIGIQLVPTSQVRYRAPEDYPEDHPGRYWPMLVQAFVYPGPALSHFRVLTMFGEPLYAQEKRSKVELFDPTMLRKMPFMLAENHTIPRDLVEYRFISDKRVLKLARKVAAAIPEAPLQGIDIVRQVPTGRLYCIESNLGGNVWEFSDSIVKQHLPFDPDIVKKRKGQFDAFRTAARLLVERTRAEAC